MSSRTKLLDRVLPTYSRGEELFNMISHICGGGFAIAAFLLCVVVAAWRRNAWGLAGGAVYGLTMIALYAMSSIYHGLTVEHPKKVFQVIDHCAIFFLIAGTYTPIALGPMRLTHPMLGWGLFAFIWVMCALGVTLTAIDLHKFRVFSMICYIAMGWCVVFAFKPLLDTLPWAAILWLLGGGVAYTVGSVLYGLGKKRKWMHALFHMFVLLGSVCHFVCILGWVM